MTSEERSSKELSFGADGSCAATVACKQGASSISPWLLVLGGLFAALATSSALCELPRWNRLSWAALLSISLKYVFAAAVAGAVGAGASLLFVGNRRSSLPAALLALNAALGWVWAPAIVLLLRQNSKWTLLPALAASICLAGCLAGHVAFTTAASNATTLHAPASIFGAKVAPSPYRGRYAKVISACLHGGALTLLMRSILPSTILLAAGAFTLTLHLVWNLGNPQQTRERRSRPGARLAWITVAAVLVTLVALLPWARNRALASQIQALLGWERTSRAATLAKEGAEDSATNPSYQSVILWPVSKDKKNILVAPQLRRDARLPMGRSTTQVIPFDGAYWYFKAPNRSPGSKAHSAHGSPLSLDIHSADGRPLAMEAHQSLGTPIDLACCSKIQVAVTNADTRARGIILGLLLTDSSSPRRAAEYLGVQPVGSAAAGHPSSAEETLEFTLARHRKLRRFDEITVVFFRTEGRPWDGAKVAIQQFMLVPR
jgi:hypothetical protein